MDTTIYLLIGVSFILAFSIGAGDETMSTLVGAKILNLKTAIVLGGVLVFSGCILLSENVGNTIGTGLLGKEVEFNYYMLYAIILSTSLWIIFASYIGAPISTTHSIVGAVFGIGIVYSIINSVTLADSINLIILVDVVLAWVLSPVLGFIFSMLMQFLIQRILAKRSTGLLKVEKTERLFSLLLLISVIITQLSRGGNDSANVIGIFYGLFQSSDITAYELNYLIIIVGVLMGLGLFIVGRKVINNVGNILSEMQPSSAFSISISTTIILFICTILGLPVSGGHILVFSILGSGWVKGERPDRKSFKTMVLSWIITFPIAAALSGILYISFIGI